MLDIEFGMDSDHLTNEQVDKLRDAIGRQLRYLNKLCGRVQRLGFPLDDPLCFAALAARDRVQDLYAATHYAKSKGGLGRGHRR